MSGDYFGCYQYKKATNGNRGIEPLAGQREDFMKGIRALCVAAIALMFAGPVRVFAQFASESTRFTIAAGPILTEPTGEFRKNLSNRVGGGGSVLYHVDRTGFFALRFDVSGIV